MPASENKTVVLYFLTNGEKTDEDRAEIGRINGLFEKVKVLLRNGNVTDTGNPEKTDYVAGPEIPALYDHVPRVDGSIPGDTSFRPSGEGFTATSDHSSEARNAQPTEQQTLEDEIGKANNGGWGAPIR